MYSRDQMPAENSRNPGFRGAFPRDPKGTVQISLQIIDVLDLEQALAKIDLPGHSRQGRGYGYILFCFDFPHFEFSPQKITCSSICSNKTSFPI